MAADSTVTIQSLSSHLQRCGYHHPLLKKKFQYADLTVPLVGFADQTYDARSACIAGINTPRLNPSDLESFADQYRKLGAPILFICGGKSLQWCFFTTQGVKIQKPIASNQLSCFFKEHKNDFSPQKIYRAKTIARLVPEKHQLHFVDVGLMPLLESQMGEQLADLIKRMIQALHDSLGKPKIDQNKGKWLFQSAFWLLAARILKDKEVDDFLNINLNDPLDTLQRVHHHYNAEQPPESYSKSQITALQAAADKLNDFGNLRNLTIESLAYVYENTLINKDVRKALGIHATPSYLVDYIVWQLAGWIKNIPQDQRIVLEPTCGHAPFLISAARLLREMTNFDDNKKLHKYLKNHLFGIEVDPFAREIARLSLTLTDIPNPNGWNLLPDDVYQGKSLQNTAANAGILLCNPPFEEFTPEDQSLYKKQGTQLKCYNKAAEVLSRTLPYMPADSVFGVIMPQGFLHSTKQTIPDLRKLLLEQFDIEIICNLPENVFTTAKHKSTVILGRKRKSKAKTFAPAPKLRYQHVQKWDLQNFIDRYQTPVEKIDQSQLLAAPNYDLRWQQLREVWDYCQHFERLGRIADVGQGLTYKIEYDPQKHRSFDIKRHLPPNAKTISSQRFKGSVQGYSEYSKDIKITKIPQCNWMNLEIDVIRYPRWGTKTGIPQLLLNYVRVGLGPWRLKGMIDKKGRPFNSNFLAIRPKDESWSLESLWAIINSPFSNAFTYCRSMGGKHNLVGTMRLLPLPECDLNSLITLNHLVKSYFSLYPEKDKILQPEPNPKEAKKRMLAIDAEVMRLYNLPPKLERKVLDLFAPWERKGVDFKSEPYYPEDFDSWIPLHEYLSEEFQRSTVSFVKEWVEKVRSPELIKALDVAVEAFREEE